MFGLDGMNFLATFLARITRSLPYGMRVSRFQPPFISEFLLRLL